MSQHESNNQFSVTISTSCDHRKNCASSVLTLYSKEEPKRDDTRLRNYITLCTKSPKLVVESVMMLRSPSSNRSVLENFTIVWCRVQ